MCTKMAHPYTTGCPCESCDEQRLTDTVMLDKWRSIVSKECTLGCPYCEAGECPRHMPPRTPAPKSPPEKAVTVRATPELLSAITAGLKGCCDIMRRQNNPRLISIYAEHIRILCELHDMVRLHTSCDDTTSPKG